MNAAGMPHSSGFDHDWLVEYLSEALDEGPLVDRKRDLWRVGRPSERRLVDDCLRARGDFIELVVAMANAARRRNRSARIVFGIDDHGDWYVSDDGLSIGVARQQTRCHDEEMLCISLSSWQQSLDQPDQFRRLQGTSSSDYRGLAKRYVTPFPAIDYHYGWVKFRGREGFVVYLEIAPSDVGPYAVTTCGEVASELDRIRESDRDHRHVVSGAHFDRMGDETRFVDDPSLLVSAREVPYIPKDRWVSYARCVRARVLRFIPDNPWPVQSIASGGVSAFDRWCRIWIADESAPRVALLEAEAGLGKTVGLCRLALELVGEIEDELVSPTRVDQPATYIPVFTSLREIATLDDLRKKVAAAVNIDGSLALGPERSLRLLGDPDLRFLLLLDGADEMSRGAPKQGLLEQFVEEYPVKVIISSRPRTLDAESECWRGLAPEVVTLMPADDLQLAGALDNVPDGAIGQILTGFAVGGIETVLRAPLYLSGLQDGEVGLQITNLGRLVEWMMERLFAHGAKGFPDRAATRRYRHRIETLAWNLQRNARQRAEWSEAAEWASEEVLGWALASGLLREPEQDQLEFSAPALQWYWSAKMLSRCSQRVDRGKWDSVLADPLPWKEGLRILANLWERDLTADGYLDAWLGLPYPWPLAVLFERRFLNIGRPVAFAPALAEAVSLGDEEWVWRGLLDPVMSIRHLVLDCIERCGAPSRWSEMLGSVIGTWEDIALTSGGDDDVGVRNLIDRVLALIGCEAGLDTHMEVQYG